jgi:peptidyl-prolyl cis-trans isomerase SurA
MRRLRSITIILLLLAPAGAFAAEVIDGVIATVNRKPILQSDWDDAVRFEAFLQQKPLSAVTEADRVAGLQRLIDRELLVLQMTDPNYLAPTHEEVRANLSRVRAQIPAADSDEGWQRMIASYGFSQREIEDNLRREMQMMSFVEVRLRPNIHVQPEEIEAYYRTQVVPELEKSGGKMVSLKEVEPSIHEVLVQRHMDELLDAWLHNLRQQSQIQSSVPLPTPKSSTGGEASGGN